MIFATYQPVDWKTWQNSRYSYLKELLGIPEEKNIYWCFAANTPEQALVSSCCTEPNQPGVLVLFETDNYWQIDKIAWNRYAETMDKSLISEELLKIRHPDMVEYIVTDIPDNCIEIPLLEIQNWNHEVGGFMMMCCGGAENMNRLLDGYFSTVSELHESADVEVGIIRDFPEKYRQQMKLLLVAKKAFENILLLPVMYAGLQILSGLSYMKRGDSVRLFIPSVEHHMEITSLYTEICSNLSELTDEQAYEHLKKCQEMIFLMYFGHNYAPASIKGTVHPKMLCPCGSGKPYKKCCAKKESLPDIYDVMTGKTVSGKES